MVFGPLTSHALRFNKTIEETWILPVCFAEVLEVVHVAAGGGILSVFSLPFLGVRDLQQVAVVLHDEITFLETAGGKHRPALSFYVLNLGTRGYGDKRHANV